MISVRILLISNELKIMDFIDKLTGQTSPIPWSLEESNALGYSRYMTNETCDECNCSPVARYIVGNHCVQCALKSSKEIWELWLMGSPDRPEPFCRSKDQALALGLKSYYHHQGILCKGGMHFLQPNVKTKKCQVCADLKRKPKLNDESTVKSLIRNFPDMVISKEDAQLLNFPIFRTTGLCRRGHSSWRYISSGACLACMRPKSYAPTFEVLKDLPAISIATQKQLFLGYGFDKNKMVDPDGMRLSRDQFNVAFKGPAHFELTNGRGTTLWPYDAFIQNFGPKRHESASQSKK